MPHPRTLRKARERVRLMVLDGLSARRIRSYLHHWSLWWVRTSTTWEYSELLKWFFGVCWEVSVAAIAAGLLLRDVKAAAPTLVPDLAVAA